MPADHCPDYLPVRRQCIEVLSLVDAGDGTTEFRSLGAIDTSMRPITLQGDLLAYSDDSSRTVVTNWRTGALALLQGADEPVDQHFQVSATVSSPLVCHKLLLRTVLLSTTGVCKSYSPTRAFWSSARAPSNYSLNRTLNLPRNA